MDELHRGQYSAAPSAIGYLYQVRYALLEALRRLPNGDQFCIEIETLDDVIFKSNGSPIEVLQTKHHINKHANLTDASPDLWKTLRIWIEGQEAGTIPHGARFFLITTDSCREGTIAAYLRAVGRDEKKAIERLISTATTSTNQTNGPAYNAFNSLDRGAQIYLIESITVLDSSPGIGQLDEKLRQSVFYAVERRFLDSYLQRLEGWWYGRVVKHLLNHEKHPIVEEEIEAEANRIREQFKVGNLPVDDDIMQATVDASGYIGRLFVEQLQLIGVNQGRIYHAIRNYYRAFEQRSRWVREKLLYVGDLERYEQRLIEEWNLVFEQMRDDIGDDAAEEEKKRAARELYKWVESNGHHRIRPAVTEPAIARGTYQILADDLRVGWHVEFGERLKTLLSEVDTAQ